MCSESLECYLLNHAVLITGGPPVRWFVISLFFPSFLSFVPLFPLFLLFDPTPPVPSRDLDGTHQARKEEGKTQGTGNYRALT